jgi:hypothetical protein
VLLVSIIVSIIVIYYTYLVSVRVEHECIQAHQLEVLAEGLQGLVQAPMSRCGVKRQYNKWV